MADFLTRLAERTLNRVPVAQPMIASVFAPGTTMPDFLPQAEEWSPVEQAREVTAISSTVPEVQGTINERQEVATAFTPIAPKPATIMTEREEQSGATPAVISQGEAAKPGRRGEHEGRPNTEESGVGVPLSLTQSGEPSTMPGRAQRGEGWRELSTVAPPQGAINRAPTPLGPRFAQPAFFTSSEKGRPYTDESLVIPSQPSIADRPPAATGQLSLYPTPAAPSLPVREGKSEIAVKHEASDSMRMRMGRTEIVSPVADSAPLIEELVGISPREASIISGDEGMALSVEEADSGEEHANSMVQQNMLPGEERPAIAYVEERFHRQVEGAQALIHFRDDNYFRGPAATPQGNRDEVGTDPTAGDHKGPHPSSAPFPPLRAQRLFPRGSIPESAELLRPRALPHADQPARAEQAHAPTGVSMPGKVGPDVPGNVLVPLAGTLILAGEQVNGGGQLPGGDVSLPHPQLLVPNVQAQQEIIASQETGLTSIEGNNLDPGLTRSQRYSSIEQERNNRLLAEQHSVLPAIETTRGAPTIHVTIGRIDVRAIAGPAPAPSSKPAKRSQALSLNDYLKQGKGGRQ